MRFRHGLHEVPHLIFLGSFWRRIDDGPARRTHEVVVVAGDPLGELEVQHAGGTVVGGEDAAIRENGERTVERREGDRLVEFLVDLGGGLRSVGAGQGLHHDSAAPGEPNTVCCEALLNGGFDLLHYPKDPDTFVLIIGTILI